MTRPVGEGGVSLSQKPLSDSAPFLQKDIDCPSGLLLGEPEEKHTRALPLRGAHGRRGPWGTSAGYTLTRTVGDSPECENGRSWPAVI